MVEAFANAPVANPDGTTSIGFYVDVGTLYGNEPRTSIPVPEGAGTWGDHGGGNQIPEAGNTIVAFDNTGIAATSFFTLKNLDPVRNNMFSTVCSVIRAERRTTPTLAWEEGREY